MLSGPGRSYKRSTWSSNGAVRSFGDGCTCEKYSRRPQSPPMVCILHINRGGGPTCIHLAKRQVESRPEEPPQKPNAAAEHVATWYSAVLAVHGRWRLPHVALVTFVSSRLLAICDGPLTCFAQQDRAASSTSPSCAIDLSEDPSWIQSGSPDSSRSEFI